MGHLQIGGCHWARQCPRHLSMLHDGHFADFIEDLMEAFIDYFYYVYNIFWFLLT